MFLDLETDPDGDPESEGWAFDLNLDDPPPLEELSFDFFRRDFLGMSGRVLAGDPSEGSFGLDDLLDCLGLSDFSFVGESVMLPVDDGLLDALGNSDKSLP